MASIKDVLLPQNKIKIDKALKSRIDRGRKRMEESASSRTECLEFWRGEQYAFVNSKNEVSYQPTVTDLDGSGKPRHRIRTKRNVLVDVVQREVAKAIQRVPGYDVLPSGTDPQKVSAARLGNKVAQYGHEKWDLRDVTERVVTHAVVADEGFAWPYFDNTIGPYYQDEEGNIVGQGEIKVLVLGGNEVYWEPGVRFTESRWFGIDRAAEPKEVMSRPGFVGGELTPDANSGDGNLTRGGKHSQEAKLVMVTDYLERPCPQYPRGRWITMANERVIIEERDYPCEDNEGNILDEPVLHPLSYFTDPDNDRDHGLVRHVLDAMRTINDCTNKQLEWKNLALAPQVVVENGEFKETVTDEPGAVYHFRGSGTVRFREVPAIPGELSQLKEEAKQDIAQIVAQNDIPSQVESGRGIEALLEADNSRRVPFHFKLADFHASLMRHCLYLVSRYYTEDRLLSIRGRFGWETIEDFRGAQLLGEADVRVDPASVEPRSRAAIEQRIMTYAQAGWIAPETAMAAINAGTAEKLIESYELDVARANLMIQKIKAGPDALFAGQMRVEPDGTEVPAWMPRPFDNLTVQKSVFEDWMKTDEFDSLPPEMQVAAMTYYNGIEALIAQKMAQEAEAQQAQAESLGMSNAAKPQLPPETPQQASPDEGSAY